MVKQIVENITKNFTSHQLCWQFLFPFISLKTTQHTEPINEQQK